MEDPRHPGLDPDETSRLGKIAVVAWISIVANAVLALSKIVGGWVSGSLAVVGDGIDSFGDILSSTLTLVTTLIISRPPDERFPWGRQRADTVATKFLAFVVFFFGAQLSYSSFLSLVNHEPRAVPTVVAFIVTGISIVVKVALAILLYRSGRSSQSGMMVANAKNMRSDVVISGVVLLGLVFSEVLGIGLIDLIFAFLVGLWIMRTGVEIFMETNTELMDGMDDKTVYFQVFDAVASVKGALNPHRTRVRKFANYYLIDIDIEVDPSLTVAAGHVISQHVEDAIKLRLKNVYDVMVHIEPEGNVEHAEKFGLDRKSL
jgi:cation diffusion facilitator family transporter